MNQFLNLAFIFPDIVSHNSFKIKIWLLGEEKWGIFIFFPLLFHAWSSDFFFFSKTCSFEVSLVFKDMYIPTLFLKLWWYTRVSPSSLTNIWYEEGTFFPHNFQALKEILLLCPCKSCKINYIVCVNS